MYNENIENINKFNLQKTAEEQQHALQIVLQK